MAKSILNSNSKKIVKKSQSKKQEAEKVLSFTKRIILGVLIMAEVQICCTYVLAFLDKTQVAETLSTQTTITIVGVVLAYCTKALFENLSKYGDLNKKKDKEEDKSKDKNKDIGSCDEDVAG